MSNPEEKQAKEDNSEEFYEKYHNSDPRCAYPFSPEPLGYCWGYALYVDGKRGYPCTKGCDMWEEKE